MPTLPSPSPVIAQSQEPPELAQATGRKMYVDPSIYASADEALQDFSKEIPPKSVRIHEEIARGMCLNCLIEESGPALLQLKLCSQCGARPLHCIVSSMQNAKKKFHDQTQECNAEEPKPSDDYNFSIIISLFMADAL